MVECEHIASGQFPAPGVPGATFLPKAKETADGVEISWENNRALPNPEAACILHGKSAYKLAVEAGYEGTEVEFAAEMAAAAVAKAKAEAAAEAAESSRQKAATSETNAKTSEENAKQSEKTAVGAAEEADQLAQAAAGSAGAAAISEQNAKTSETNAGNAASAAVAAANAVQEVAGAVQEAEQNAAASKEAAAQSAKEAEEAAKNAKGLILSGPATPGQLLRVKAVDEEGRPTEYETVEPTHGEGMPVVVDVLPEVAMTFPEDEPMAGVVTLGLVVGETYTVNWNGTAYECTAIEFTEGDVSAVVIGNPAMTGGEDNGIPFVVADFPAQNMTICSPMDGSTQATVGITQVKVDVKKLDNKYLNLNWLPTYETEEMEVLPTTQFGNFNKTTDSSGKVVYTSLDTVDVIEPIVAGKEYTVYWNGVGYVFTACEFGGFVCLGTENDAFSVLYEAAGNVVMFGQYAEAESATVRVVYNVKTFNRVPNEFLDLDWIPTKTETLFAAEETVTNVHFEGIQAVTKADVTDGMELIVYFDKQRYICKVFSLDDDTSTAVMAGNLGLMHESLPNTGEPFLLQFIGNSTDVYCSDGEHTVSLYTFKPIPMPPEFMPESLNYIILNSSTPGSTKKFKLTIDDTGTPSCTEVTT